MLLEAGSVNAVPKKDECGAIVSDEFKMKLDFKSAKLQLENIFSAASETIHRKIELFVTYEYNQQNRNWSWFGVRCLVSRVVTNWHS
jgi:hypothetical protein